MFFLTALLNLYAIILMLRLLMQLVAPFYRDALFIFLSNLTNPVVRPVSFLFKFTKHKEIVALIFLILVFQTFSLWAFIGFTHVSIVGFLMILFGKLGNLLIDIYFYILLIQAILSWFRPLANNALIFWANALSQPLLTSLRAIIPSFSGLDFSPLIAMFLLKAVSFILLNPIISYGWHFVLAI